jgi:DNA repair protein RadC
MTNPRQVEAIHYREKFRHFWGVEHLAERELLAWMQDELAAHDEAESLVADLVDHLVLDDLSDPMDRGR